MADAAVSLLIVDALGGVVTQMSGAARAAGYRVTEATWVAQAVAAHPDELFDAALIHVDSQRGCGIDPIGLLKSHAPDTEIIALSATSPPGSIPHSSHGEAFASLRTPVDDTQLFATIRRAIDWRRLQLHNRRLVWELQTITEIEECISRSLELEDVLAGPLQRLVVAMGAVGGSIRLRDDETGAYTTHASIGGVHIQQLWEGHGLRPPSEEVIATRASVLVEDFADLVSDLSRVGLPVRSAISVPMLVEDTLLGTITLGAALPSRFTLADDRLLSALAAQIAVAVQNARLHAAVRRAKSEWERTFDAIADPIAVFDSRGRLLRGNRALATRLGSPITALRGARCGEVGFCGGGCPGCSIGRALAGAASRAEITVGADQIFSVTTFPVQGVNDGASVVQVAKNVTEEIRSARRVAQMGAELTVANEQLKGTLERLSSTQAQLLQAEKLSAIGQLVAGVAHELNNPLTSVIGYAQLLQEELSAPESEAEPRPRSELALDLGRVAEESERAARIVRNLLAFARRQTAARAPQDVVEIANRVLSLRTYELRLNAIELCTEFETRLPHVLVDTGQIQQALLNLILNAEQAMRGAPVRKLTVGARLDRGAGAVELYVSDTGHGIDPANVSRIFDPFFTTRDVGEGTGLGLSICYGIVRDHGGQIAVDSKVHTGTTFTLLLPARVDDIPSHANPLLVAHSDQSDHEFISAVLTGWGYRVIAIPRTDAALARYRLGGLRAALVDRRIVAGDVPGWSAALAIDAQRLPLILLSIPTDDGDVGRFGREHASAVLEPPYQLRTLRSAVRAVAKEYA